MNGGGGQDYFFFTTAFNDIPVEKPGGEALTPRRSSFDDDEIDRTTRSFVLENADCQPSRSPGQRVQIGSARVKQRAVGTIIMAMDDMEIVKAVGKSLGIALAQQRLQVLTLQSGAGLSG